MPFVDNGEILLRHTAIGVNFIDIYYHNGFYKLPSYPVIIGQEGVGMVEAVGSGVTTLKIGDRVAYCGGPLGAYAQYRVITASRLVKIPVDVSDQVSASVNTKRVGRPVLIMPDI